MDDTANGHSGQFHKLKFRRTRTVRDLLNLNDDDFLSWAKNGTTFEGDDLDDAMELARQHREGEDSEYLATPEESGIPVLKKPPCPSFQGLDIDVHD